MFRSISRTTTGSSRLGALSARVDKIAQGKRTVFRIGDHLYKHLGEPEKIAILWGEDTHEGLLSIVSMEKKGYRLRQVVDGARDVGTVRFPDIVKDAISSKWHSCKFRWAEDIETDQGTMRGFLVAMPHALLRSQVDDVTGYHLSYQAACLPVHTTSVDAEKYKEVSRKILTSAAKKGDKFLVRGITGYRRNVTEEVLKRMGTGEGCEKLILQGGYLSKKGEQVRESLLGSA